MAVTIIYILCIKVLQINQMELALALATATIVFNAAHVGHGAHVDHNTSCGQMYNHM